MPDGEPIPPEVVVLGNRSVLVYALTPARIGTSSRRARSPFRWRARRVGISPAWLALRHQRAHRRSTRAQRTRRRRPAARAEPGRHGAAHVGTAVAGPTPAPAPGRRPTPGPRPARGDRPCTAAAVEAQGRRHARRASRGSEEAHAQSRRRRRTASARPRRGRRNERRPHHVRRTSEDEAAAQETGRCGRGRRSPRGSASHAQARRVRHAQSRRAAAGRGRLQARGIAAGGRRARRRRTRRTFASRRRDTGCRRIRSCRRFHRRTPRARSSHGCRRSCCAAARCRGSASSRPDANNINAKIPWLALVVIAEGEGQLSGEVPVARVCHAGCRADRDRTTSPPASISPCRDTVVKKVFPTEEDLRSARPRARGRHQRHRARHRRRRRISRGGAGEPAAAVRSGRLPAGALPRLPHQPRRTARRAAAAADRPRLTFVATELVQDVRVMAASQSSFTPDQVVMGKGVRQTTLSGLGPRSRRGERREVSRAGRRELRRAADQEPGRRAAGRAARRQVEAVACRPHRPKQAASCATRWAPGCAFRSSSSSRSRRTRFPVLAHWSFTTTGAGSFRTLMQGLDVGLLGTLPADPLARPQAGLHAGGERRRPAVPTADAPRSGSDRDRSHRPRTPDPARRPPPRLVSRPVHAARDDARRGGERRPAAARTHERSAPPRSCPTAAKISPSPARSRSAVCSRCRSPRSCRR